MSWEDCPICGYKRYNADEYECCYECSMKEQGKVLCAECKEIWHDDNYPTCFQCKPVEKPMIENDDNTLSFPSSDDV